MVQSQLAATETNCESSRRLSETSTTSNVAGIRLASILGLRNAASTATAAGPETPPSSAGGMTPAKSKTDLGTGSSPAANWFKDKYQLAQNKFMSKV